MTGAKATRDFSELYAAMQANVAVRVADGWREPIPNGTGFHCVYDRKFAKGDWSFQQLQRGLWLITVDMVAERKLFRKHSFGRKLVITAVLNGGVAMHGSHGVDGQLSDGFCTVYGLDHGDCFETVYESGQCLRWMTIILDQCALFETIGLPVSAGPSVIRQFSAGDVLTPYLHTTLSPSAYFITTQILDCRIAPALRSGYLRAKALEFIYVLFQDLDAQSALTATSAPVSEADRQKITLAMQHLKASLDDPPTIAELATAVGLSRQKLQQGFREAYGTSVGSVRDALRAERALELVCNTSKSMLEIALETGYEHSPSFTRAFKVAYGISPREMRRMGKYRK